MKATNQGPVFHCDHPSIVLGWLSFKPSDLAYFSTVADNFHFKRLLERNQSLHLDRKMHTCVQIRSSTLVVTAVLTYRVGQSADSEFDVESSRFLSLTGRSNLKIRPGEWSALAPCFWLRLQSHTITQLGKLGVTAAATQGQQAHVDVMIRCCQSRASRKWMSRVFRPSRQQPRVNVRSLGLCGLPPLAREPLALAE
jgi:hypothetical protein